VPVYAVAFFGYAAFSPVLAPPYWEAATPIRSKTATPTPAPINRVSCGISFTTFVT